MIAVSAPATTQWPVRLLQALPWAVGPVLAVTAAVLWYSVVGLAVDRLDGSSSEPREDIVAFYVAGKLLREGRAGDLYIVDVVAQEEAAVLGRPAGYHGGLAFLNPPFVAALFAPLSLLPYRIAQAVWLAVDIAALGLALALLAPELRRLGRGWRIVFVLGVLASFPVFIALLYVQLSPLVLLSWVGSYRLIRAGREHWAGIVLAGALMKPPLALLPAAFLLVSGRWRVVASFGVASLALAAASVALVGPDTAIRAYGQLLSESAAWRFDFGIDRPHMFGWTGFFSLALGERLTALASSLAVGASLATLVVALWLVWRLRGGEDRGRALLVAAAATVLANPHMHVQDLVVLALPAAVLLVARRGWLDVAVPALFVPLPAVALTGLNLMTPLLAGLLCYLALEEAGVARRLATGWQLARRVKWQGGRPVLVPARA